MKNAIPTLVAGSLFGCFLYVIVVTVFSDNMLSMLFSHDSSQDPLFQLAGADFFFDHLLYAAFAGFCTSLIVFPFIKPKWSVIGEILRAFCVPMVVLSLFCVGDIYQQGWQEIFALPWMLFVFLLMTYLPMMPYLVPLSLLFLLVLRYTKFYKGPNFQKPFIFPRGPVKAVLSVLFLLLTGTYLLSMQIFYHTVLKKNASAFMQHYEPIRTESVHLNLEPFNDINGGDKEIFFQYLASNFNWNVTVARNKTNELDRQRLKIIAKRKSQSFVALDSSLETAVPPKAFEHRKVLEITLGLYDQFAEDIIPFPVGMAPKPQIIEANASELPIQVTALPGREEYHSDVIVRGKDIWVRIMEESSDIERTLTEAALKGLLREFKTFKDDLQKNGSFSKSSLETTSVKEIGDAQRIEIDPIKGVNGIKTSLTGYLNQGEPGFICVTISGDRVNRGLSMCGENGSNLNFPGWSNNPHELFHFELGAYFPGPGDGEPYPYSHKYILWFFPLKGGDPIQIGEGSV